MLEGLPYLEILLALPIVAAMYSSIFGGAKRGRQSESVEELRSQVDALQRELARARKTHGESGEARVLFAFVARNVNRDSLRT